MFEYQPFGKYADFAGWNATYDAELHVFYSPHVCDYYSVSIFMCSTCGSMCRISELSNHHLTSIIEM